MREIIKQRINDSIEVKKGLLENESLLENLECLTHEIKKAIRKGHKLVLCGNGGSASDALHFAGEIVGRFIRERDAWPAVVLNADVATMTAIGNDYGYDDVFSRQAQAHCQEGDVFIGISTSGNSENVRRALEMAKSKGCKTAALLGKDGGIIGKIADIPLIVPCNTTARVQESHILLIHIMCELVERDLEVDREIGK
ncbi:SIS domain-containing protein [Ruminococcus sp. AM28-41]|jgi:D-sedoheptulose 7-phosphate isomerase|nr:D-sedoheptulose 7-phosphate isomerase [uncultured Blautia sp.]RHT62602.1 SIS domain-containing protein [Ruminococcus sp. AM28-41]